MPVEISLLGPVEATRDGERVDLGPPQQRALLALLAVRPGEVVTVDAIVDALWPEDPPASATKIVQTYVSRLRKALGDETITRTGRGYAVDGSGTTVDLALFEQYVKRGEYHEALALWRGPALVDVRGSSALRQEADRLEELRLRAVEDRIDAELASGNPADVVPELSALVAEHPLRERLVEQLMVALYGAGRQAEALDVYRRVREKLVDELGLEPSPRLKELERRVLTQDPDLAPKRARHQVAPPARDRAPARRSPRRWIYGAAAAAVAVAAAVAALAVAGDGTDDVVIRPNSIIRIDPETNEVVESFPVGRVPTGIMATPDAVWVVNERDRTVSRLDTRTGDRETIGGLEAASFVARDERGNVYVSAFDYPFVWRIDPETVEVVERYRVRSRAIDLQVGGGSLWVVDRLVNAVTRIDLARGSVEETIPVGRDPLAAAFGYGALWVANSDDATVSVIRPGVAKPDTINVKSKPFGIAAGEGGVWVGSNTWSTVTRIDPETRRVVKEIPVSSSPAWPSGLFGVETGAGAVWAANWDELSVVRIDPRTNRVAARITLPVSPRQIAIEGDDVWVSVVEPGSEY